MKKFLLIYNPVSGGGVFKKRLDEIIKIFQRHKCLIIPYRTTPKDLGLLDYIKMTDLEGIIISGGDGTLNKVIDLMLKENINLPIGIFPTGTSNDFASCLDISANKLTDYISIIIKGRTKLIDVGKVNGRYFINVVSAGMMTSIAHDVDRRLKNAFGKFAYYMRGIGELPKFRALDLTINSDGVIKNYSAFFVLIVNSKVVASLKNISTKAKLDDGKLDLILFKECNIPEMVTFTAEIMSKKPIANNKNIVYLQAKNFVINCNSRQHLESDIDGETGPYLPLKIETIKHALRIYY